jgi:hypothetical protein
MNRKPSAGIVVCLSSVVLLLCAGCEPGGEIPMGPGQCDVPQFIGAPAGTEPLPAFAIPEHPGLAPQGTNGMHGDSYCTGTYPWAGPRGVHPQVRSLSMGPIGGMFATVAVDSLGRLVCVSGGFLDFKLLLVDPVSLEILASHSLPQRASMEEFLRTGDWNVIMGDTSGGAYFHLDDQDRPIIVNADKLLQIFSVQDSGGVLEWQVDREYDLGAVLPEDADVTDAVPDWDGRIWFVTRPGILGVVDPADGSVLTTELFHEEGGEIVREEIQNTLAVAEDGVYIVSDHALYRFQRNPENGHPESTWREPYDRGTTVKPGAINQGSGTTPTLLGDDLVAITDNADGRVNVLIYRRLPGVAGERRVCAVPVFDDGFSVSENSLIGYGRSVIVENNYLLSSISPMDPSPRVVPGVVRIDVNPEGTSCTQVWENREASSTTVPKLSIGNGLVYLYTRSADTPDDIVAWYLTALDFRTGETVFKIFTGTGMHWNNSYAPTTIGPDGTVYVGVFNGITAVRDGDGTEPPRNLGCPPPAWGAAETAAASRHGMESARAAGILNLGLCLLLPAAVTLWLLRIRGPFFHGNRRG